ncbi:hypothetical protein [Ohtaekwangia sp.]|uniref:hypothetical protein n=1 Tax=Ohtaekwangia sp. TaxID=2066019 RepID=UPI002FDE8A3B
MKKKLLLLPVFYCLFIKAFSQEEIPVDLNSGSPSIHVPLWTVTDHDLADNVLLYYNPDDLNLGATVEPWYGAGWAVTGGGTITRQIRGLPDDINESTGLLRKGWLYLNASGTRVSNDIGSFAASANNSVADCSDEAADNAKLSNLNFVQDTESDIYYFNGPNLTGAFMFDNAATPTIRLIPYQDVTITYTTVANSITSFTIKNGNGTTYTFGTVAANTKTTSSIVNGIAPMQADYQFYRNGVTYNAVWGLTQVLSPSGAHLDYTYATQTTSFDQDVRVGVYSQASPALTKLAMVKLYHVNETIKRLYVSSITGAGGSKLTFDYTNGLFNGVKMYDLRGGSSSVKEIQLGYKIVSTPLSHRHFLKTVVEISGCTRMSPYTFSYLNEDGLPVTRYPASDVWGYYNASDDGMSDLASAQTKYHQVPKLYVYPSEKPHNRVRLYPIPNYSGTQIVLDGAYRLPDPGAMKIGALSKITYPAGGTMQLTFEANTYYDTLAAGNQYAGGLRIKQIDYFDAINSSNIVTNKYIYEDTVTHRSFGRLINVPSFLIPVFKYRNPDSYAITSNDIAYSSSFSISDQWKLFTVRSEINLNSAGGAPVQYQNVVVHRAGAGWAKFQYLEPAQYGNALSDQWTPALDKFARANTTPCANMGLIAKAESWVYPYAPNPNYDYARGLLEHKYEYNEAFTLVRETYNEYQDLFKPGLTAPARIYGLLYDIYPHSVDPNIYLYSKYYMLSDMGKALLRSTVTTYDAANAARNRQAKTEYYYDGTSHRLLTRAKAINADGTIYTTKIKYPLDFGTIAANSDNSLLRIKDLQTAGRNSTPIETIQYFQRSSTDSLRAISAELVKYDNFTPGGVLPKEHYALQASKPVTNFTESAPVLQGSTYVLNTDSRYELDNTMTSYTANWHLVSAIGLGRVPATTIYGYTGTVPVAQVSHVAQSAGSNVQFAFSDFETTTGNEFMLTNPYYGAGYTGAQAIHPYATLTKTVTKAANTTAYAVSFRAKTASATAFMVNIVIKNTAGTTTYVNDTIKVLANTAFVFKRKSFNVAAAPSDMVITLNGVGFSAPTGSASLWPLLDDVAFYPDQAAMNSYTYQFPYGITATTAHASGVTGFTEYDAIGRTRLTRDMDGNIITRNTYNFPTGISLVATFALPSAPLYAADTRTFTATGNACVPNANYSWRLTKSDGTVLATQSSTSTTFTCSFTALGSYIMYLDVSAANYTTQSSSTSFTLSGYKPYTGLGICHKGISEVGCISNTVLAGCVGQSGASPNTMTYFDVSTTGAGVTGTPTYQWKMRNLGTSAWTDMTTNAQFSFKPLPGTPSLEVMCVITTADGRSGSTPIDTVIIDNCSAQ